MSVDLDEILGCTGIVTKPTPAKVEEELSFQTRPRKPIKPPDRVYDQRKGETREQAQARWIKTQARWLNNKQRACSRVESLIHVDEETREPYLYMIFSGLKRAVAKGNPLHAALLGDRSPKSRDREVIKGKAADRILVGVICHHQNFADGRPNYDVWFNKAGKLIVRFPIGRHLYHTIPLYDE